MINNSSDLEWSITLVQGGKCYGNFINITNLECEPCKTSASNNI